MEVETDRQEVRLGQRTNRTSPPASPLRGRIRSEVAVVAEVRVESAWKWPGSRWWRVDLHAHSPASHDFKADGTSAAGQARRWIESARDASLDAIAVTDHNSSAFVSALQQAAVEVDNAPILFPGLELTANDGSHLLLIVDPGSGQENIDDLLSRMEIPVEVRGETTARTSLSVEAVLDRCDDRTLVVAAHVNGQAGLLDHVGQQRIAELRDPRLAAVEILPDTQYDESWLDGSKAEIGRRVSQIWASDSHTFDDLGKRYTWVKMTQPTLEGLRLALSDGSDSLKPVRREYSGDPNAHAEMAIESITVRETKHIGRSSPTEVRFNPWMNAIIGGRGTGKSTLLDLFRKVMRRDVDLDSVREGEEGSLRHLFDDRMQVPPTRSASGLLTERSRVEVVYRKDGDRFLLAWSEDGTAHPIRRINNGDHVPEQGNVQERFRVQIYSQKQLFALAQNPNALLSVLDETHEVGGAETSRELKRLRDRYLALRAEVRAALTHAAERPGRQASLGDVQRKLDVLQQGGHAEVLRLYRSRRQADGIWKAILAASEKGLDAVSETVRAMAVSDLNLPTDDEAGQALRHAHEALCQLIEGFRSEVLGSIDDVRRQLAELLESLDAREWAAAVNSSEDAYRSVISQLKEEGIADPEEYRELVEKARRLESEIDNLGAEELRARELEREAAAVLAEYRDARTQLSAKRQDFVRRVSSDTLRVEVNRLADFSDLRERLREELGIERFDDDRKLIAERIRPQEDAEWDWESLDDVVATMRAFQSAETESWDSKDPRFALKLRTLPAERVDRLALYLPEDILIVSFRSGASGPWRPIAQGSPGQKTAALLAFVLGFGSEPIVLDQPEDDLDSTLIYELLVRRFRETKPTRQLIMVTHNPNIVVHGDAEYVLSLEVRDSQTAISHNGGLQEEDVREEICRVMEGGIEAFESRYKRMMPLGRAR